MNPTRILIADDHAIFRQGMRKLFDEHPEFEVVGEASNGAEAIEAVAKCNPDVLLLDLQLGDMTGHDVLRQICNATCKIILLGADIQRSDEVTALLLGAHGIGGKYSASETLFQSIKTVLTGEIWIKRDVIGDLIEIMRGGKDGAGGNPLGHFGLTARERDIVKAVVQGLGNREISQFLGISQFTVKHYMTRIFDKLLVSNRVELAMLATRQGLVPNGAARPN